MQRIKTNGIMVIYCNEVSIIGFVLVSKGICSLYCIILDYITIKHIEYTVIVELYKMYIINNMQQRDMIEATQNGINIDVIGLSVFL